MAESQGWCFVGCIAQFEQTIAGHVELYLVCFCMRWQYFSYSGVGRFKGFIDLRGWGSIEVVGFSFDFTLVGGRR